ncbi:hypothetical protein QBC38DRAFT_513108 [Podospora fimiseda]|uniref:WSC domain-containing protein n=1 Tax=Podospora fimiseda TaxID=252190 RepID=A0AAN6YMY6_9PEZI|nr:hypothetical protein QBC38DRAFT_513108 [Podospora fimiseda]
MYIKTILTTLGLVTSTLAANSERRFAVLRHTGGPLTTCRADPIVAPGGPSAHVHTVMGASNFGFNANGQDLLKSSCTTAKLKGDLSSYWFPKLYFKDPSTGKLEPVPFFYMNVYYFFDATNDDIKSFPVGLQIVSGNAMLRAAPPGANGEANLDPSRGTVQPAQLTCPRSNFNPPSWPAGSDGSMAGIGDPRNQGSGMGFPFQNCDGYASPLRADVHMPSCYNPQAGLTNYKNNMAFPSTASNGRLDCPPGWIHVPHMFFETYWDTAKFAPRFQQLIGKESPFVFSNGDATGFSVHADFISGWDEDELQNIIDNCNTGHAGLHTNKCEIECPVKEDVTGPLDKLPGNNPIRGWQYGSGGGSNPAPNPGPVIEPSPIPSSSPAPNPPAPTIKSEAPEPVPSSKAPEPVPSSKVEEPAPAPPSSTEAAAPPPVTTTLVPVVTKPAVQPSPTPEVSTRPVIDVVDGKTTTVWDTVTVWQTKTVYADDAAPTKSAEKEGAQIAGFQYVGCYKDISNRVLTGKILPKLGDVSNTNCVNFCSEKGFSVAGTEYGGECYCGNALNKLEKLDDSKCSFTCKGDASQKCGGDWALSLYTKGGTQVYALALESSKWSSILKEVVENSELLKKERKLTPALSILLTHDLLLSKSGIALPQSHGLRASIDRHKARLTSEFTKARIRRKCPTLDSLRGLVESALGPVHPRWIRVNSVKSTLDEQLDTTFKGFRVVPTIKEIMEGTPGSKLICLDGNIPNLIACSPGVIDFGKSEAYKRGEIILQDKASCFPAYLLDPRPEEEEGEDIVDACSAPGNKTTHLGAILSERGGGKSRVYAFEKDKVRAKTLEKMVRVAGLEEVTRIYAGMDFLRSDPESSEYAKVSCLLLDPSCSGSGIVGRDDAPEFCLPSVETGKSEPAAQKKRKREEQKEEETVVVDDDGQSTSLSPQALEARIKALSDFQLQIILHAFKFPSAKKVTYSTCSIYPGENEGVVLRALSSEIAKKRGWRILKREEQVRGMREWEVRGWVDECGGDMEIAEGCIRAERGDGRGTMGFFVVGFVRDGEGKEVECPYERDEEGRVLRGVEGWPVLKGGRMVVGGEEGGEDEDEEREGKRRKGDEGEGDDEEDDEWGGFDD